MRGDAPDSRSCFFAVMTAQIQSSRPAPLRRLLPWIGMGFTLSAFLLYLASLHMAGNFGRYHDDTLYFSSAQALAQGRGYILPSLPGNPPQTKYPILYP